MRSLKKSTKVYLSASPAKTFDALDGPGHVLLARDSGESVSAFMARIVPAMKTGANAVFVRYSDLRPLNVYAIDDYVGRMSGIDPARLNIVMDA